jgi:hypothetical protein
MMRNVLLGIATCTSLATSIVVLVIGLGIGRPSLQESIEKMVANSKSSAVEKSDPSDPKSAAGTPEGLLHPFELEGGTIPTKEKPQNLSEVIALLSEIEGMILDSEKTLRADLRTIYEKLLSRIDTLQAKAQATEGNETAAMAAFRSRLKELGVTVHSEQHMVEVVGEIVAPSRALELAVVAPGGRAHEALIMIEVTPSALKLALEDIGLVESEPNEADGKYDPDAKGATIYVIWDGIKKPRQLADLILNSKTNTTMVRAPWMFTASRTFTDTRTWERQFAADIYKNVVSLTWNYSLDAVLASPLEDAQDETIWSPHPDLCPPAGTKIRMFFCRDPNLQWDKF